MATETRQVVVGDTISLEIDIVDALGNKTDADTIPSVSIYNDASTIIRPPSTLGVVRSQLGRYTLDFVVPSNAVTGVWTDKWEAVVDGFAVNTSLSFVVLSAEQAEELGDIELGDDPILNLTQADLFGLNILLRQLRIRLADFNLKAEHIDEYGNITFEDCPIFMDEELMYMLINSLSYFNAIPHFTNFTFADPVIYDRYSYFIIQGAYITALSGKMLLEAGREFNLTDSGVSLTPPSLSTAMNNAISQFVTLHDTNIKYIKNSIKPAPRGFGGYYVMASNPQFRKLRHLRERKII